MELDTWLCDVTANNTYGYVLQHEVKLFIFSESSNHSMNYCKKWREEIYKIVITQILEISAICHNYIESETKWN